MAVPPLLATIAGCAAPGPGPVAAAAAPGPDPAPGLVGALPGPDSDDCRTGGVSGHNLGTGGFSTVAKAMAYETLATSRHNRHPSDTFSLRFDRPGPALVRERHNLGWEVHRFERNPYGWTGVGSRFGSLGCPEPSAFELPGRFLEVPEGRSVTRDICFGDRGGTCPGVGREMARPGVPITLAGRGGKPEASARAGPPRGRPGS